MSGIFNKFENPKLKLTRPFMVVLAVILLFISLVITISVNAADLTNRSVTIGSSVAGATTTHDFRFNTSTNASIGSVVFEYCSNLPIYGAPCTPPTGLNVSGVGIFSQSGLNGFSVSGLTNANRIVLTRAPIVFAPLLANILFSNAVNQNTVSTSYVRISTHSSIDGTGSPIDNGSVVYATSDSVGIGGYVPPFLTFCVGETVQIDCSSTSGSLASFGEFSEFSTNTVTSQFSAATNDDTGYNTFINGQTMTSGNEIINPLAVNSPSIVGNSQFGMNLRANTSPSSGSNVGGSGTGIPAPNYNIPNSYRFVNGELIASSVLPTDFNRYTVTYIVNVSDNQRPGTYSTTLTYTAIASF
jgi:hypothetical protein